MIGEFRRCGIADERTSVVAGCSYAVFDIEKRTEKMRSVYAIELLIRNDDRDPEKLIAIRSHSGVNLDSHHLGWRQSFPSGLLDRRFDIHQCSHRHIPIRCYP